MGVVESSGWGRESVVEDAEKRVGSGPLVSNSKELRDTVSWQGHLLQAEKRSLKGIVAQKMHATVAGE